MRPDRSSGPGSRGWRSRRAWLREKNPWARPWQEVRPDGRPVKALSPDSVRRLRARWYRYWQELLQADRMRASAKAAALRAKGSFWGNAGERARLERAKRSVYSARSKMKRLHRRMNALGVALPQSEERRFTQAMYRYDIHQGIDKRGEPVKVYSKL